MSNIDVIAESIDYLVAHYQEAPSLDNLADRAGYEVTHFQKLFKDKVGISPKRLCQYMHMTSARELLVNGESTLFAAQESGLSGNARLHDLFVSCQGVTPGQVQNRGKGLEIVYGITPTVLGRALIAKTQRGVCWMGFMVDQSETYCVQKIAKHWPLAHVVRDDSAIEEEARHFMSIWSGQGEQESKPLKLDLYGTNFQLQVWQALLQIPNGQTLTYQDIARDMGRPKSSRAVGNAVGANPISVLIPCHRVIRATGIIDNYAWGSPRKKLVLVSEQQLIYKEVI